MLVLFLILALGYGAGKCRVMSLEGNKSLSLVVNCIANPCNILYSALCGEHALSNGEVLRLLLITVGLYAGMILVAQVVPLLLRAPKEQKNQYKFMMIFSNVGYMGIPVISAIYGESAVFEISIVIMVFYVALYTYGVFLIRGGGGKFRPRDLLSPMMVSSVAGLLFYLCNVRAPAVVGDVLYAVRGIASPAAMLIIGCALSAIPVRSLFTNGRLYGVALLKLAVLPAASYFLLRPLLPNPTTLGVMVAVMAMPVASNFTILSAQYDKDQKLASASVFLTTLLSVGTIPLLMGLLFAGA